MKRKAQQHLEAPPAAQPPPPRGISPFRYLQPTLDELQGMMSAALQSLVDANAKTKRQFLAAKKQKELELANLRQATRAVKAETKQLLEQSHAMAADMLSLLLQVNPAQAFALMDDARKQQQRAKEQKEAAEKEQQQQQQQQRAKDKEADEEEEEEEEEEELQETMMLPVMEEEVVVAQPQRQQEGGEKEEEEEEEENTTQQHKTSAVSSQDDLDTAVFRRGKVMEKEEEEEEEEEDDHQDYRQLTKLRAGADGVAHRLQLTAEDNADSESEEGAPSFFYG